MHFPQFSNESKIFNCFTTVPEYLLSVRHGAVAEEVASAVVAAADPQPHQLRHLVGHAILRGVLILEEAFKN